MDDFAFSNEQPVEGEETGDCALCGGEPGCADCHCVADPDTGFCEACDMGEGECPCPQIIEEQMKMAADIRKAALDTPFKLGL